MGGPQVQATVYPCGLILSFFPCLGLSILFPLGDLETLHSYQWESLAFSGR